jgi:hypothetical protein
MLFGEFPPSFFSLSLIVGTVVRKMISVTNYDCHHRILPSTLVLVLCALEVVEWAK